MTQWPWALACFLLSSFGVSAFLRMSRQRLVDAPGSRSSHAQPTPTGGGFPAVSTWLLVSVTAMIAGAVPPNKSTVIASIVAATLAVIGLADDAYDLPRALRYGIHVAAGLVVVLVLGWIRWPAGLPSVVQAALWVMVITALINAFNFMDGIDALVGGSGSIVLAWLAIWTGELSWWLLASAYTGFLVFNFPPARVFMGDAGSTTMGGMIGIAFVAGARTLHAEHAVVLAPLMGDSAYTLTRRLLRGENIFRAHHSHLYQRLLRAGHRAGRISAGYAAATVACGAAAHWAGATGALLSLSVCVLTVVAIELHVARRGVPFTRPPAPVRG
jgi:UDP-N-acetylmuramyl pentapeptide phosphotransferase/UDP-N-acetylglucosamine-1-phosphate transferase